MNFFKLFHNSKKHYNLYITGEVQKVGFRRFARRLAKEAGLSGFVQYYYDALYVEVEGQEQKVLGFVNDCRLGPSNAEVEDFQMEEGMYQGYGRFKIVPSIKS